MSGQSVVRVLLAMFGQMEKLSGKSLTLCFSVFLELLIQCQRTFLLENLPRILRVLNRSILADPALMSARQFPDVLQRIVDSRPDPNDVVVNFGTLFLKLTASLFYEAAGARDFAADFLRKLFGAERLNYGAIFQSLARLFIACDKRTDRYVELVESVVRFVCRRPGIALEDMEVLAEMVRPLARIKERPARQVVAAFVAEVSRCAAKSDQETLGRYLALMTGVMAPETPAT